MWRLWGGVKTSRERARSEGFHSWRGQQTLPWMALGAHERPYKNSWKAAFYSHGSREQQHACMQNRSKGDHERKSKGCQMPPGVLASTGLAPGALEVWSPWQQEGLAHIWITAQLTTAWNLFSWRAPWASHTTILEVLLLIVSLLYSKLSKTHYFLLKENLCSLAWFSVFCII